jgi:hypothetical protein
MAPKESSSRFHPYDTPKKSSSTGRQVKPRANTGLSVNELKRRIRDVKRLLTRGDLPPDARIVQERALAGYEKDLKEETEKRKRSEMIKKYHFVRFLGSSCLIILVALKRFPILIYFHYFRPKSSHQRAQTASTTTERDERVD